MLSKDLKRQDGLVRVEITDHCETPSDTCHAIIVDSMKQVIVEHCHYEKDTKGFHLGFWEKFNIMVEWYAYVLCTTIET